MTHAWWYISNNFGDNLNHYLIHAITGKPVIYSQRNRPHNIVCGSILAECNEWSTVWGAGFGNKDQRINTRHADIRMVRGHLSARILYDTAPIRDLDIAVGDPALLLPKYYQPVYTRSKLGIIPHYCQYEEMLTKYPGAFIIDPFLPVTEFIDKIASCKAVVSSSLHGLIVADAYGIPNSWLRYGDEFKYRDYYSVTDNPKEPIDEVQWNNCFVSTNNLDLLKSCPFYAP